MLNFYVKKSNGQEEIFYYKKLESSLRKAGASEDTIKEIIDEISKEAKDGITTREIYDKAFSILRKKHKPIAVRYSLKKAVEMLGPSGFPFEKFIAEIFRARGYEAVTDQVVQGKCVSHEVDIVAWKPHELVMVEAKFHSDFNIKSDLKIVLYVRARYDDIFGREYEYGGEKRKLTEGWVITNTKFSSTAIKYGECQPGLRFVGWNYPYNFNLHQLIERYELIPITALTTLSASEKSRLISENIILSKTLMDTQLLKKMNFEDAHIKMIQEEVGSICESCKRNNI